MYKRIISCVLLISILLTFIKLSAFADDPIILGGWDVFSFWEEVIENDKISTVLDQFIDEDFYGSGCEGNNGGPHHWEFHGEIITGFTLGKYFCPRCGKYREDIIQDAYDSYVSDLTYPGVSDIGGFYLPVYHNYTSTRIGTSQSNNYGYAYCEHSENPYSRNGVTFSCSDNVASTSYSGSKNSTEWVYVAWEWDCPCAGSYVCSDCNVECTGISLDSNIGGTYNTAINASFPYHVSKRILCKNGDNNFTVTCYAPSVYFVPNNSNYIQDVESNDSEYAPKTRFTNYTFNLGTVYNGDVTNVYNNQTIINETNMTMTNPSTGTTYNITNWIYNYTDRSVHGVTEDGDTYNVRFGDEYLTINIGGDEYTYYYVVENQVCDHHYVISSQTPPSCTASGSVTYSCSECGDTYTDTVPALGHNYQFIQSVPASGEDPGYDLFRCTRCGDEYTDSTFFNDDSDDANYWAWLKTWLQSSRNWLGDKLDAILDKDTSVNVDQDVNIDLPDVNIGFQYVDEAGEQQTWNPGELRSKFAFWKDVRDIGIELYDSVQPTAVRNGSFDPPELIIHLGAAESNYGVTYGGDEYAMDLSWYEPYKSTVDGIAGGFLWLLYLYGVWKHLPDIFSGAGMLDNRVADLQAGERHSRRREKD